MSSSRTFELPGCVCRFLAEITKAGWSCLSAPPITTLINTSKTMSSRFLPSFLFLLPCILECVHERYCDDSETNSPGNKSRPSRFHCPQIMNMTVDLICREDDLTSITGVVGVVDLSGISLGHAMQMTPSMIRKAVNSWQVHLALASARWKLIIVMKPPFDRLIPHSTTPTFWATFSLCIDICC